MPQNNWKTATFVLVGLLGVQFWWWNKKAPEVLNLGRGGGGGYGQFRMRE